jgi:hypothetical protein
VYFITKNNSFSCFIHLDILYKKENLVIRSEMCYTFRTVTQGRRGDFMDIASLSTAVSNANTQSAYSVAMLSKSLDQASSTGSQIVGMMDAAAMERSVNPYIGGNIDISV